MELARRTDNTAKDKAADLAAAQPAEVEVARSRAFERLLAEEVAAHALAAQESRTSRRQVLRSLVSGAIAVASCAGIAHQRGEQTASKSEGRQREKYATPELFATERLGRFAWDSMLFQCGQIAAAYLCRLHNIPIGNPGVQRGVPDRSSMEALVRVFQREPHLLGAMYVNTTWVAPIAEEALFRIIPSALVGAGGMQWQVGLPSSFAFMAYHSCLDRNTPTNRAVTLSSNLKVSLDTIPLQQFMLGAFCWYAARSYGALAPILAHSLNNHAAFVALVLGGRQTYSRFLALFEEELLAPGSVEAQRAQGDVLLGTK